jgi:Uncharacterized conserved protein (DUF2190)
MPYSRPGYMFYATATKAVDHGKPCVENGVAGVAVKQKAVSSAAGLGGSPDPQKNIAIGEKFAIISKGVVQIDNTGSFVVGNPIYIIAATNLLTATSAGNVKFGMCVEIAGQRGTPTGKMRVDLDKKDTF